MTNISTQSEVNNRDFIATLFNHLPQGALPVVCGFEGDPASVPKSAWGVSGVSKRTYNPALHNQNANNYICISSFYKDEERRKYRRRKEDFAALHVVMIDDLGTGPGAKVAMDKLAMKPTALVETSPDNYQAWLVLAEPITSRGRAEQLIDALIYQGLMAENDPGMSGVTRLGRLPVGFNGKEKYGGWDVQLVEYDPGIAYTEQEIIDAFGLVLEEHDDEMLIDRVVDAIADPVFSELKKLGVVKSKLNDRWYDITCPWVHEHTEGLDNGTGYRLGGGFECHHGHCQDRDHTDLIRWLEDEHQLSMEPLAVMARAALSLPAEPEDGAQDTLFDHGHRRGEEPGDPAWLHDHIVTLATGGYYDLSRHEYLPSPKVLNALYGHLSEVIIGPRGGRTVVRPDVLISNNPDKLAAFGLCWQPVRDFEYEPIIRLDHHKMVNTFTPPRIEAVPGDVSLWLKLVNHICGEYADLVLDHMAYTVQHPAKKIAWQVLIVGKPRTGKTMMFSPLVNMLGGMASVVSSESLRTGWGDVFARRKVLLVEEVYGFDGRMFNQLKPKFSNSDIEALNIKGEKHIYQQNLYSMYMLTNHDDAFKMDEDEDKLLVLRAPDNQIDDTALYKQLGELRHDHEYLAHCFHYLLSRDVSDFPYGVLPVRTQALAEVCRAARSGYVQFLEEMIDTEMAPFDNRTVKISRVIEALKEHHQQANMKGVAKALEKMGWVNCKGQQKIKGKGYVSRFWARKSEVENLTSSELYDYERGVG